MADKGCRKCTRGGVLLEKNSLIIISCGKCEVSETLNPPSLGTSPRLCPQSPPQGPWIPNQGIEPAPPSSLCFRSFLQESDPSIGGKRPSALAVICRLSRGQPAPQSTVLLCQNASKIHHLSLGDGTLWKTSSLFVVMSG